MDNERIHKVQGSITEILYDENKLTISLAYTVNLEVSYSNDLIEIVNHLMESQEVELTVKDLGWKTMSYPHLTHDVLEGTMTSIKEVY